MLAKELIKDTLPPLKTSDTIGRALSWMDEFRLHYLPLVEDSNYLGLVSEVELMAFDEPNKALGTLPLHLAPPSINADQHIYECLKFVTSHKYELIPVVDDNNMYLGIITIKDLIESFAVMQSVQAPGGIIVLEVNESDYSIAEIAKIAESNGVRILNASVQRATEYSKLLITLKLNVADLTRIEAAYNRFDYKVIATYHHSSHSSDLQNRYEGLMNYLNI